MKIQHKVIALSIILGIIVSVADSVMHSFLFHEGSIWDVLILDVPAVDVYMRTVAFASVVIFGALMSIVLAKRERAEAARQESETSYRILFENIPIGVGIANYTGILLAFNDAMLKPSGYTRADIDRMGNVGHLYFDPSDRDRALTLAAKQGFLDQYEVRFRRKDGTSYDALLSLRPVRFRGQQCWQAMVEDITERKTAETQIKERNQELTALREVGQAVSGSLDLDAVAAQALEVALKVLGMDAGAVRYVDEDTQELVLLCHQGLPEEMVRERQARPRVKIGEGLTGRVAQLGEPLVGEDFSKDIRTAYRSNMVSGFHSYIGFPLKAEGKVVGAMNCVSRHRRTFSPAELDMVGSIGNMVGMAIANARLFSQVETAGREWQQSFDAMSEGVSILSTDHRILRANLALARMLGTTPEALVGRHCYEVFHGREEEPLEDCPMTHCMAGKRACDLVRQEPHLGNRWLHLYTDPVLGPQGEVLSVVHTARDITALKQMEQEQEGLLRAHQEQSRLLTSSNMELENALAKVTQAEEKLQELYKEEKGLRHELQTEMERRVEFTRALVHELKTPLTPVLASSSVLVDELQGEPLLNLARNIEQGASNLNNRIDELLDLARGEIGMLHLNPQPVEPLRLLSVIANYMAPVASSHSQTLTLDLPPSLPLVWADEGRLRQIVLNLLSNAAKFTPEGGKITLRARGTGANLVIEVQDSGHGISKEEQQRLFEPYHRLERDRERLSGLGLGLALCKTLVELHGGRIWVESSVGQGSTFIFSVPLKASRPRAKSRKGRDET
jgi:PAS domain S-box-containing protein